MPKVIGAGAAWFKKFGKKTKKKAARKARRNKGRGR